MNGIASPNIRPVAHWDDLKDTPAVAPQTAIARPQAPHLLELLAENQRLIDQQASSMDALEELDRQLSQAGRLLRGSDSRLQQGVEGDNNNNSNNSPFPPVGHSNGFRTPSVVDNRYLKSTQQLQQQHRHHHHHHHHQNTSSYRTPSQVVQRQLSERNPSTPIILSQRHNISIPISAPAPIPVPLPEEYSKRRRSRSPEGQRASVRTPSVSSDAVFVPGARHAHVTFGRVYEENAPDDTHIHPSKKYFNSHRPRQGRVSRIVEEGHPIETPQPYIDVYDDHRYGNRPLGSESLSNVCREISSSMNDLRHQILTEPSLLYKKECSNEPDLATLQVQKIQDAATFAVSSRKPTDNYTISNAFHYDDVQPGRDEHKLSSQTGAIPATGYNNIVTGSASKDTLRSPPRSQAQPIRLTRMDAPVRYSPPKDLSLMSQSSHYY